MRLAILSDAMLPTPQPGGHGLGRVVSIVAEGLLTRGHDVTLFARPGSAFSGRMVTPADAAGHNDYRGENALAREVVRMHRDWPFDVALDNGHLHILARLFPDLPVINVFHDQYQQPARCAVVLSEGQRALMPPPFERARIIRNTLRAEDFTPNDVPSDDPPYALWMGALVDFKNPLLAIEACARYGIQLVMAGAQMVGRLPWNDNGNVRYVGIQTGERRDALLRNARVSLQLGEGESFGLTTLEAGLSGTPVVAWPGGGSLDLVSYGINGVFVSTSGGDAVQNVCDAIERAYWMDRKKVRAYSETLCDADRQLDEYEHALSDCARGVRW